jgi:subtilisin family serine protease
MLSVRKPGPRKLGVALTAGAAAGGLFLLSALPAAAVTAVAPSLDAASGGSAAMSAAGMDEGMFQEQWVLDMLDVQPAWSLTQGKGVTVAVIDSGVNPKVTDLQGAVISGPDYTGLKTSPQSSRWGQHGTWMASIIAGNGENGGLLGIAPEATILSIRVIPDTTDPGYHTYDNEPEQQIQDELAEGILTAVKQYHAQVISMSIGYSAPSGVVRAALQYAYDHGAVLVASSGNSGQNDEKHDYGWSPVSFPADYPGVLSVAAVDEHGKPASFSSSNLSVQVAAPGSGVPAQGRDNQYYTVDGTSPACALVAGVAALIKAEYPKISPALVMQAITSTTQPGSGGYNVHTGFGIVDADAALTEAGRLLKQHPASSQISLAGHFGGGAAAVPAAPVVQRGSGRLVLFSVLAAISLAAAAGGLAAARRARAHRYRPWHG